MSRNNGPTVGLLLATAMLAATACTPSEFVWDDSLPAHLASYRASFEAAAGDSVGAELDRDDLLAQTRDVRVLWLGDHHRSQRLHGLHREVLDRLAADRPVHLLLEALGTQDQPHVDAFLRGDTTLDELARRMRRRWTGSWLDDPELDPYYYRSLCNLARRRGWALTALEPTPRPPLAVRDERIAARVRSIAARHPDALLVVIVGQAHLLGQGDLIARTELPSLAIGGEPPRALANAARKSPGRVYRSGGLWWFAETFGDG